MSYYTNRTVVIPDGYKVVPIRPSREQMRALLLMRGHDPDADMETISRTELVTMSEFLRIYTLLVQAAEEPARS